MMSMHYSDDFRDEAVRLVLDGKSSVARIAPGLGISTWTLRDWVKKHRERATGSEGRIPESLEEENRRPRCEPGVLRQERDLLKKGGGVLRERATVRYALIDAHIGKSPLCLTCRVFDESRSGYFTKPGVSGPKAIGARRIGCC